MQHSAKAGWAAGRILRASAGLAAVWGVLAGSPHAQARPVLNTDLVSQDGAIELGLRNGSAAVHRGLDVALIDLSETRGRLTYGLSFQYGALMATNPNDFLGHELDHRSLRIDREVYVGANASLRSFGRWRLTAGAGRLQLRVHNGFDDTTSNWALNEPTLMGWRMTAGVERPMRTGALRLGWQVTHYDSRQSSDVSQPLRGSASRVLLEYSAGL
ncbi:MAG: hypothetical protein KGH96_04860 [Sphingomonadales bacterium]|nr:hypothetical protein [Sphingomonadales bacterium]